MNMYTNTKKSKKFILILVLLILFSFCYPKRAEAMLELEDFPAIPAQIFYVAEKGILKYLNNLFTNDEHHTSTTIENEKYEAESYSVYLTPENIIKGKFILFDANIFKNIENSSEYYDDGAFGGAINSGKESLRNVIAGWYYALRNFAIVALLSVLVYIGIRMIMSTIAQDKAKYKVMFKDWLVALCLVVVMHYMMIGILNISSMITDAFGGGQNANTIGKLTERISGVLSESSSTNEDGGKDWFDRHYAYTDDEGTYDLGDAYAFILVLGGIIIYTFIFGIKYLKREFTIIFLILLGPVSCITYPIDKISDGKAQAFNKWFTEFLYQVIIQPFHLLLYIVLIGSAVELANKNVIYALVCFAVMIPAEKFIKEMFGFKDELGSPLGAFAGGAVASQLFNKMKGGSSTGKSEKGSDSSSSELPVKTKDAPLPGTENASIDTSNRPELDEPEDGSMDTSNRTELDEPEDGSMDTSNRTELDEPEDGSMDTSNRPELDEPEDESVDTSGENAEKPKERSKFQKGIDAVRDRYNRKVMGKYGTLNKKELAKKRAWRATKGLGRLAGKTIRGATTLAGAAAIGTLGFMTGQGAKGALAGAALGKGLGNKITKNSLVSKTGEYAGTFYNAARGKDTNKEKYKSNQNNIDRARRNFRDRNGYLGSGDDIDKELESMYKMTTYGVKDENIENAMNQYNHNRTPIEDGGEGMSDSEAINFAIQSALEAQTYSAKDFRDEKAMKGLYEDLYNQYIAAGFSADKADENTRKIIKDAGQLKGVSRVALPPVKEKVTIPNANNFYGKWNFEETQEQQDVQLERFSTLQAELISEGEYSREDIDVIVKSCSGNSNIELVDSFELKVKYLTNSNVDKAARVHVEKQEENKGLTEDQIKEKVKIEKIERLGVREATGVNNEKTISKLREMEEKSGTTEFREVGGKAIRGELSKNDKNSMSEKTLEMSDKYKSIVKSEIAKENPNTTTKKKKRHK